MYNKVCEINRGWGNSSQIYSFPTRPILLVVFNTLGPEKNGRYFDNISQSIYVKEIFIFWICCFRTSILTLHHSFQLNPTRVKSGYPCNTATDSLCSSDLQSYNLGRRSQIIWDLQKVLPWNTIRFIDLHTSGPDVCKSINLIVFHGDICF